MRERRSNNGLTTGEDDARLRLRQRLRGKLRAQEVEIGAGEWPAVRMHLAQAQQKHQRLQDIARPEHAQAGALLLLLLILPDVALKRLIELARVKAVRRLFVVEATR